VDSFTYALGELDPANRALLDLSLRRGMRPEEISELLGTDPESVIVAREQALEQLAAQLGMGDVSEIDHVRTRLAELPAEAWTPPPPEPAEEDERPPLKLVAPDEAPRRPEPAEPPQQPRRRRMPVLLTLLALVVLFLVIVLASNGGDDKKTASSTPVTSKPATPGARPSGKPKPVKPSATKPPKPKPAKPPKPASPAPTTGPQAKLAPVAGSSHGATGTAALLDGGRRLRLDVSGLPDPHGGAYEVWLYNSVIDAHSLVSEKGTNVKLDLKLPANASRWHFVDISLEPADGNPNHSGDSVLRVALSKLAR
jgi:hypothetical protein